MRDFGLSAGAVGLCNKEEKSSWSRNPQEQLESLMKNHVVNASASRSERRRDTRVTAAVHP